MKGFTGALVALSAAFWLVSRLVAQGPADKFIPVTQKDLNDPDPADWLMLGGNMGHWNYSRLDQINRGNVGGLQLVWARQLPTTGGRREAGSRPLWRQDLHRDFGKYGGRAGCANR